MKKKLSLLLLMVLVVFSMVACKKQPKKFVVTYKGVTATKVEDPETKAVSYTYETTTVGTESVAKGATITGVATADDGTKYFADKYYTNEEIKAEEPAEYNLSTKVEADFELFADAKSYAVFQDLATGTGYTLNYATTIFPSTWNSHIYETETDSTILDYSSSGFYEFDYNETKDGFVWADQMAVGDPKDVSSDYVGEKWGIEEGDVARAWEVTLRNDLCWDDGTPITSQDFVESAIRLLNPKAQNSRADDYTYEGDFVVHNARSYLFQGQKLDEAVGGFYASPKDAVKDGKKVVLDKVFVDAALEEWIGADLETLMAAPYYDAYIVRYFAIFTGEGENRAPAIDKDGNVVTFFSKYNVLNAEDGKIEFTEEMYNDYANCDKWNPDPDSELGILCSINVDYPVMDFEDVGIKATAPNKVVYILDKELAGFYLKYGMSAYLVKTDVYDACDNLDENGNLPEGQAYRNTYCTDATNSPSYGPYKLAEYQLNKYFKIVKNDNWWGYKDAKNQGLYQTTTIVYTMAESAATRLQMFLSGKFDSYGLQANDMNDYQDSDYTYYTDGDSTWFIMFNPDVKAYENNEYEYTTDEEGNSVKGAHKNIDKQILAITEFRQAISFALDRTAFELACDPTGNVAKALFSPLIVSDPEKGTAYRTTPEAKDAIVKFWGLDDQIGPNKLYEDIDAAIETITGYNLPMAKTLFDTAYDKAVELGYMDSDDVVEICIGTSNLTSAYYNNGYNFLVNCYTDAVKGTKLEGKLTFTRNGTLGSGFADALRNNVVDMLFGVGWTGSALNPYSLVAAYTTSGQRYQSDLDYSKKFADVSLPRSVVEGIDSDEYAVYTADVAKWTATLSGTEITVTKGSGENAETFTVSFGTSADYTIRGIVLAAIELAVLRDYCAIPIAYDSSASMRSMKYEYYTEEYVYGVGRGGVKYYKFNYNDSEWAAFVASKGGKLNYKVSSGE